LEIITIVIEVALGGLVGYVLAKKNNLDQYVKGMENEHRIVMQCFEDERNKSLVEFERLMIHEHDYEKFFEDTWGTKDPDYNLYDLVAKYGAIYVVDKFREWNEGRKAVK